ncbi:MAG: AMP-binding protein, partial [Bacteroidota bacterium]
FDLAKDYMLRAHLIECSARDHVLVLVVHHIASDAWSQSILVNDLATLYQAHLEKRSVDLPDLPLQYADYAIWQRAQASKGDLSEKLDWWANQLRGVEPLEVPTDFPRGSTQSTNGDDVRFSIDRPTTDRLKTLSQQNGATLFMTLLAAIKVLLYRYSRQTDICIGTPMANRERKELESIVGYFINTLALRNSLADNPRFIDFLNQVKTNTLAAYANQEIPFEQVVGKVARDRSLSRTAIFQTSFTWHNTPDFPNQRFDEMDLESVNANRGSTFFELTFSAKETRGGLAMEILFCTDLYQRSTIERMAQHGQALIASIVTDPQQHLDQLSLLTPEEENQLLTEFNPVRSTYAASHSLIDRFQQIVRSQPQAIALIFGNEEMTYETLDHRSNQLANALLQRDIQKGDRVGILAYRGFEMLISVFAVLKCGATYIPLNIDYPEHRLEYMLKDADAQLLLISNARLVEGMSLAPIPTFLISDANELSSNSVQVLTNANDEVYVMYTSGTTGEPKGILVNQGNVLKLVDEQKYIRIDASDRVMQWSNFAFDGSIYEIFNTLLSGATLQLITETDAPDVNRLAQIIEEQKLSLIFITTALFNTFVDAKLDALQNLRKILFGGEKVSVLHVKKALSVLGPDKLIHMYGPTETTTYATYYPVQSCDDEVVPIGAPLSNTTIYIVNDAGQLAGIGVVGEIWIGGD